MASKSTNDPEVTDGDPRLRADGADGELPADRVVGPLAIRDVPPLADPEARSPRPSTTRSERRRLRRSPGAADDACILICDITRPVPNRTILRPMLEVLDEAGIPREQDADPGRHRPAPAQHGGREAGDARRGDRGRLSRRGPFRHAARRAHAGRHDVARHSRLDRQPLRPGRPEDRHRLDRAAPDGRLLGRPQADLPGRGRARDGQALARARAARASQGRLRHPGRQPGPRAEHRDRPDGGLRLHRQRHARQPAPRHLGRGRRHGAGVPGRRRFMRRVSAAPACPRRWTSWSPARPAIRWTRRSTRRSRG